MSLFCKDVTCSKAICQKCHLHDHKSHNVVDIIDHGEHIRARFQDTCDLIRASYKERVQDLRLVEATITKEFKDTKTKMKKTKKDMIEQIGKYFEENLEKVNENYNSSSSVLSKTRAAIQTLSEDTKTISHLQRNAGKLRGNGVIEKNEKNLERLSFLVKRTNQDIKAVASCKHTSLNFVPPVWLELKTSYLYGVLFSTSKDIKTFREIHHSDLPDNPLTGNPVYEYLPPASAVDLIESVPSVCL